MAYVNAVVDISHHNGIVDLRRANAAGIVAILQKATQGTSFVDPTFASNLQRATDAGLLWGAYHFGNGDDGVAQADYFLQTVQPAANTLLVLDFEQNRNGPTMSLQEAIDFVTHIEAQTGRWPGLYGGYFLKQQAIGNDLGALQNCWLWLSQYGPTAVVPSAWAGWTLWQYTDGASGQAPYSVDGIGRCDRNYYYDSLENLQTQWQTGSLAVV